MADDLTALEDWLSPLLKSLSSSEKRKFNKTLATGLRKRQAKRIALQQNPDGSSYQAKRPRKKDKAGRIRHSKKMFLNLRKFRHLKAVAKTDQASVGFNGRISRIARIHQEGLVSRVAPGGPLYRYPVRRLLGFSADDRDWLFGESKKHLNL